MTPLAAFRSRIAPRVMTALDPAIDQAVLDTCIDFCEQTLIYKATLDAMFTAAQEAEYELDALCQPDTAVCRTMRVWCNGFELAARAEDDVGNPFGYIDLVEGLTVVLGQPTQFNEPAPGVLRLFPIPDKQYQLTLRAALRPKRSATEVPDILFEDWVDAIVDGTLVRLYSTPGVSYAQPKFVTPHAGAYKIGVNRALLQATRGRTRPALFVRPVPM